MSVIIILGSHRDCHAQHMLRHCLHQHLDAVLFDAGDYPHKVCISWDPAKADGVLHLASRHIPFSQVHSAFWSSFTVHSALRAEPATHGMVVLNDTASMLRTFMEDERIAWLNSWAVYQYHKVKPRQLMHARQLGALIPQTYIGNNPERAAAFLKQHRKSIFKPVYGGALCAKIEPAHTRPTHLQRVLQVSPVTLQAYISGDNIRTYVIGDRCFSATVQSDNIDYRCDEATRIVRHNLPRVIERQAIDITRAFGMGWSAIDWRLSDDGEYFFLEANPSPMFMHFEMLTGYPITDTLLKWLTSTHPAIGSQEVTNRIIAKHQLS